jgi:LysR family transcriptional regulator, glycine cleavage system transcriptional activator
MDQPDLPLASLRGFAAAVRTESFTAAARELHVTHGAISRQIRALEDAVGVRLFERVHRRAIPTRAGRALHRHVAGALDQLAAGTLELRRGTGGPLVVSCEPTMTQHWLIPRLARLARTMPGVALDVTAAGGPVDFAATGIDLAIRRLDFACPEDVTVTPLADEWIGPVVAPAAAGRRNLPRLHTRTRRDAWAWWQARPGHQVAARGDRTFDHFWLSIEAAIAGLGIAMGPFPLVERALAARQLVAPYGFVRGDLGYGILMPSGAGDPRLDRLVAWLVDQGRAMRPPIRAASPRGGSAPPPRRVARPPSSTARPRARTRRSRS